jgi:hypothetical protein
MTLLDFILWVQSPGIYESAMGSCRELSLKILGGK